MATLSAGAFEPLAGQGPREVVHLNDPAEPPGQYLISPDGSVVVHTVPNGLRAVPVRGGDPTPLAPELGAPGDRSWLRNLLFLPDSTAVVVTVQRGVEDPAQLFLVPLDGGPAHRLSKGSQSVTSRVVVSPDGAWVVYLQQDLDSGFALFATPVNGGDPIRLDAETSPARYSTDRRLPSVQVSPDSSTVLYVSGGDGGPPTSLYSVPLNGGAEPTRVSAPHDHHFDVAAAAITDDSSTVVYLARRYDGRRGAQDLYQAPLAGGTVVRLNGEPDDEDAEDTTVEDFAVTTDSTSVVSVQRSRQSEFAGALHVTQLQTGKTTMLAVTESTHDVLDILITPDDSQIVFLASRRFSRRPTRQVLSVSVHDRIATELSVEGDVALLGMTPDGSRVLFSQPQPNSDPTIPETTAGLFSARYAGGGVVRLTPGDSSLQRRGTLPRMVVSSDSSTAAFVVTTADDREELVASSIATGTLLARHSNPGEHATFLDFAISADAQTMIAAVDDEPGVGPAVALVSVPIAAPVANPDVGLDVDVGGGGEADVETDPHTGGHQHACLGVSATIVGTADDDELVGTSGPDVIVGLGGDDVIDGRGGADVICGGDGHDVIRGRSGDDQLHGNRGSDRILGGSGSDVIRGGPGSDWISGQRGGDEIRGQSGDDTIFGRSGADVLFGNKGQDRIDGGSGGDVLRGGRGLDACRGGTGMDFIRACES